MNKKTQTAAILKPIEGDVLSTRIEWITERDQLVSQAQGVEEVNDDHALEIAGGVLTDLKKHAKELGQIRLKVTRPIDKVKKQIMAQEKELVAKLNAETDRIKRLCDAYATKKAREAEEARRQAAEEQAQKEMETTSVFGSQATTREAEAPLPVPSGPSTSSNRMVTRWSFQITDPKAVPREFCTPDPVKIRAYMNMQTKMDRTPDMPGVRFDSRVSVESKG